MSAQNNKARPWGQYSLCMSLFVGGCALLSITMLVNYAQGYSIGVDDTSRRYYSWASLAVDGIGVALFAFLVGALHRVDRHIEAYLMSIVVLGFAAFSLTMFYGFGAANRNAPVKIAQAQHNSELAAMIESRTKQDAARAAHVTFLQSESRRLADRARNVKLSKEQREAAREQQQDTLDRLGQASFGTLEIKAAPVERIVDPQAQALSEQSGLSVDAVQSLLQTWLGLLLIVGKGLCFGYASSLWPRRVEEAVLEAKVSEDKSDTDTILEPVAVAPAVPAPVLAPDLVSAPEPVMPIIEIVKDHEPVQALDEMTVNDILANLHKSDLALPDHVKSSMAMTHASDERQVEDFVDKATRPGRAARHAASQCYQHYQRWAEATGTEYIMSQQAFGRAMTRLNEAEKIRWPRTSDGKINYYSGRALDFSAPWAYHDEDDFMLTAEAA